MSRKAGLWEPPNAKHKRGKWVAGGVLVVGFVHSNVGLRAIIVRPHRQLGHGTDGQYEAVDASLLRDLGPGEDWNPLVQVMEAYEKKATA